MRRSQDFHSREPQVFPLVSLTILFRAHDESHLSHRLRSPMDGMDVQEPFGWQCLLEVFLHREAEFPDQFLVGTFPQTAWILRTSGFWPNRSRMDDSEIALLLTNSILGCPTGIRQNRPPLPCGIDHETQQPVEAPDAHNIHQAPHSFHCLNSQFDQSVRSAMILMCCGNSFAFAS